MKSKSLRFRFALLLLTGIDYAGIGAVGSVSAAELPGTDARRCALRESLAEAVVTYPQLRWSDIRSACDSGIAAAKANDPVGFSWFVNAGNGFIGTPLVLLKIFPDLAPDIWGDEGSFFSRFGFFPDPDIPGRILPRGLGITSGAGRPVDALGRPTGEIDYSKPGLFYVSLACGSCHTGQMTTDNGRKVLEGAPNTQIDVRKWRKAFSMTLANYLTPEKIGTKDAPGETTTRLMAIVDSKPTGFFANGLPGLPDAAAAKVDALQRKIFKDHIIEVLNGFAAGAGLRAAAMELQLHPGSSYGHGDRSPGLAGYSAGQSDGSGDLLVDLLAAKHLGESDKDLEAFLNGRYPELPPFATVTDIPSVWNQQDHAVGQWDGSVLYRFWRNIAAQLPIIGDPTKVDLNNTYIVAEFLLGLPAPAYPFDVDLAKAAKGEALYAAHCADCHRPNNARQYWELQTDFNRAQVLTPSGSELFLSSFQAACHDKNFTYVNRNGITVRPCVASANAILRDTTDADHQGYIASELDGIWARAPYLHNGSVPTLRHLLKPMTRPQRFLRGVSEYDRRNVGWVWDSGLKKDYQQTMPTLFEYDTQRDAWTNVGHDKDLLMNQKRYRLDWSDPAYASDLDDLIEYLKTL